MEFDLAGLFKKSSFADLIYRFLSFFFRDSGDFSFGVFRLNHGEFEGSLWALIEIADVKMSL